MSKMCYIQDNVLIARTNMYINNQYVDDDIKIDDMINLILVYHIYKILKRS